MVKSLSSNINIMIAQYIIEPKKTLKKWVKPFAKIYSLVNFEYVYCRYYPDKINIYVLSKSNSIIAKVILKYLPDKIDWNSVSVNPSSGLQIIKKNLDEINCGGC